MRALKLTACAGMALGLSAGVCGADPDLVTPPGLVAGAHPFVELDLSSGWVSNTTGAREEVVYRTVITVPGANWVRLQFDDVLLSGSVQDGSGSLIRVTSTFDGHAQYLNQVQVQQWHQTSAYFNGDSVMVEILARPGTGVSHLAVTGAWAGLDQGVVPESICGTTDDRVLSYDNRAARYLPAGCTAWVITDSAKCLLSAGHCVSSPGVIQFNVPLSNCAQFSCIQHPPPEDQYSVDNATMQSVNGGIGNDWAYFNVFPNTNTGLVPYQAYGMAYDLAPAAPTATGNENIRITGYGTTSAPVNPQWYLAQKTHVGPYVTLTGTTVRYATDTTGGNSGSAVLWEEMNLAIGVHSHAGCTSSGGSNQGTAIQNAGLQNALANPRGSCQGPPPPPPVPAPPLFLAASTAGNVGTVATNDAGFVTVAAAGMDFDGMAYDPVNKWFYLSARVGPTLYRMDEATYAMTQLGVISGMTQAWGLAYDPATETLYSINQNNAQLFTIDLNTLVATPVGAGFGPSVGGIEIDTSTGTLYGLRDQAGGTRLVILDKVTGFQTDIGPLGAGIVDCDGLAYDAHTDTLYTIDDSTDTLYTINKFTGQATAIGRVSVPVGASYGMAAGSTPVVCVADMSGSSDPNDPAYGVPDGQIDSADFFYFLDQFVAGNLDVADLSGSSDPNDPAYGVPDGQIDSADFFYFLDQFVAGCP
ncbi:MAG: hypothetical protein KF866_05230 [Phycisphaeraceae bacterium]|nr:hypothetical protein [Phycisphaeraceae bacterium]MCW5754396.1 hypothetical protein [Phycisphaeraceae bacterium]